MADGNSPDTSESTLNFINQNSKLGRTYEDKLGQIRAVREVGRGSTTATQAAQRLSEAAAQAVRDRPAIQADRDRLKARLEQLEAQKASKEIMNQPGEGTKEQEFDTDDGNRAVQEAIRITSQPTEVLDK